MMSVSAESTSSDIRSYLSRCAGGATNLHGFQGTNENCHNFRRSVRTHTEQAIRSVIAETNRLV